MIDIFTLMIGNYVGHKDHPKDVYQVVALDLHNAHSCKLIEEPLGYAVEASCSDLTPILLTRNILEIVFGFKTQTKTVSLNVGGELFNYATLDHGPALWHSSGRGFTLDAVIRPGKTVFFNSVHELQNLWLTNTHQKIKAEVEKLIPLVV